MRIGEYFHQIEESIEEYSLPPCGRCWRESFAISHDGEGRYKGGTTGLQERKARGVLCIGEFDAKGGSLGVHGLWAYRQEHRFGSGRKDHDKDP